MKNTLHDLRLHLFEQLERLKDEDLNLDEEVKKAQAMSSLSSNIIASAKLEVQVRMKMGEDVMRQSDLLKIEGGQS
jgi:hypothetical protein